MAHVGKLFPVAFRRDLNLNVKENRYYLARSWTFSFFGIFGSWGLKLAGERFVQLHEVDPGPGQMAAWQFPFTPFEGRTFKVNMWAEESPGTDYQIVAEVIDSVLGLFGKFYRPIINADRYNQIVVNARPDPPPHGAIFNAFGPSSQIILLPLRWDEYNVLNP